MFVIIKGETSLLLVLDALLLFISYVFFFLFGYALVIINHQRKYWTWLPPLVVLLFLGLPLLTNPSSPENWIISTRYFLGFPAGILCAVGFLSYRRNSLTGQIGLKVAGYFTAAAVIFAAYGILAGLVVGKEDFFPASIINQVAFISLFGLPVQLFRALAAIGLAWCVWKIMTLFNLEDRYRHEQIEARAADLAKFPSENPNPVLRVAADGTILYANTASRSLLRQWDREVGKPVPDSWHRLVEGVLRSKKIKQNIDIEHEGKTLSFVATPVVDGSYINLYGLDITERVKANELSSELNNLNTVISSTLDLDEILRQVCAESVKALGCESVGIIMREDHSWVPTYSSGALPKEIIGRKLAAKTTKPLDTIAETKDLIVSNDTLSDERIDQGLIEELRISSLLAVPLIMRENVVGILAFQYHSTPVAFTKAQVDFSEKLATSVSLAIQNAQSHALTEQALSDATALRRM